MSAYHGSQGHGPRPFLKKKFRIGSCKGRIGYKKEEKAFHGSDVPKAAKDARAYIKRRMQPDIVGQHKPIWNISTDTGVPPCVKKQHRVAAYDRPVYRFNYRAEKFPPPTPAYEPKSSKLQFDARSVSTALEKDVLVHSYRTLEMPVHPNLADKEQWNNTTMVHRDERSNSLLATNFRKRKPKKVRAPKNYISPVERERLHMEELREALRKERARPHEDGKHVPIYNILKKEEPLPYPFKPNVNVAPNPEGTIAGRVYMGKFKSWQRKYVDHSSTTVLC